MAAIFGFIPTIIDACNRNADIIERRRQFTQKTVKELADQGYNAVVVAKHCGYRSRGHTIEDSQNYEGVDWAIFAAPQGEVFIVENRGHNSYENWALRGTNWVRWGNIVKFHGDWNEATMGKCYETRPRSHFPGWGDEPAWVGCRLGV